MPRQQVDRRTRGHVEKGRHRHVVVSESGEGPRVDDPFDGGDALDTPLKVLGLFEVVEGDGGVVVRVSRSELKMAGGDGAHDLLEDEAASEGGVVQVFH